MDEREECDIPPRLNLALSTGRDTLRAEVRGALLALLEELQDGMYVSLTVDPPEVFVDRWLDEYDSNYNDEHCLEERPFPPWSQYA